MVLVAKKAPNFIAPTVLSNGNIVDDFNFREYCDGKLSILFFWPMDFTFVCPSEVIALNNIYPILEEKNIAVVGVSVDSVYVHSTWRNTLPKDGGIGKVRFPIVSDITKKIQIAYGVEHHKLRVALRAVFIIDSDWYVRHQTVNDLPIGRNIKEIIRIIEALHFHERFGDVCPANWTHGDEGIPTSAEGVKKYLSKYSQIL